MKKIVLLLLACVILCSHDMYLKLDTYFLDPGSNSQILLFNGTFDKSDNVINRNRMTDVSLVGNGKRTQLDTTQWTEDGETTALNFRAGDPGTWVAGVSTKARNIEMEAQAFNDYLEHDGVLDMLKWRNENNAMNEPAVEKYSKHVKAIYQVGDKLTNDYQAVLGYPIEFIPLGNPYDLHPGHALEFELLFQGQPLTNQLVYVGAKGQHAHDHEGDETHSHEHDHGDEASHSHDHDDGHSHDHDHGDDVSHSHDHDEAHAHDHDTEESHDHDHDEESHSHSDGMTQFRTDKNGRIAVDISHEGIWYLRTIHLVESEEKGLTHESNWATLTFEIGEGHSHEHVHAHDDTEHAHDNEGGIPGYVYLLGSLVIVAVLFFIFNRQSK